MIGLVLALALTQQPDTVPLIVDGRVQVITVEQAERLLESKDQKLRVAAELALGSNSTGNVTPGLTGSRERLDWEVRRGVRQPAQRDNYYPGNE